MGWLLLPGAMLTSFMDMVAAGLYTLLRGFWGIGGGVGVLGRLSG